MKIKTAVRLRRVSQVFFLCLFLYLLFACRYSSLSLDLSSKDPSALTAVNSFFHFDPFIAVSHLISTRTLPPPFLLSILTLCSAAILGRFFCGWICPFGTVHHAVGRIGSLLRTRRGMVDQGRYLAGQNIKIWLLLVLVILSFFTLLQPAIFDPLSILARSMTLFIFPAIHFAASGVLKNIADADLPLLDPAAEGIFSFLESRQLIGKHILFQSALTTGTIFFLLTVANLWRARFWCRYLCPLGALLAISSRFSILRMSKKNEKCTSCGICTMNCQGASSPEGNVRWKGRECLLCLNCLYLCSEDVLDFSILGVRDLSDYSIDLTRRGLIASVGAGVVAIPLLRLIEKPQNLPRLIRPPGARRERDFLAACLRCGNCSRICPTAAIHPSITEAGIEGLWTPRIVPRTGYCVYSCTLCGQVCPSQAIRRLTPEEKMGSDAVRPVKLGTSVVDRKRCISWSKGLPCLACEEVCPVSPKAIKIEEVLAKDQDGSEFKLGRPVVDSFRCVGCGYCEYVCPVEGRAAIRVFSTGESRRVT